MELRQLRYFVTAARTLNFSEAAKSVYVTQSTLSQQIRQLETELGVQLFDRNSHEVVLTEAGEELLPYAVKTLESAETCVLHIHDIQNLLSGTLTIGVTYTFIPILTETVRGFMKEYPEVRLNICCKTMEELMVMLAKREVDFVLAFRPTCRYANIESHAIFDNRLAAIVRADHPLAGKCAVSIGDIEPYGLILPSRGLQARNTLESLLSRYDGHSLKVKAELNEVNILLQLVRQGNMITILSEATIHNEPGLVALPFDVQGCEMEGCIHMLRNSYRKRSAKEFIRMLGESDAVRRRSQDWL
ncbi:MAG: LysR substrate-binding domain-containing protein [Bacteroides sp.]|nr:LysR substrate-binding domain-containing protein [Bacteroides sp.]